MKLFVGLNVWALPAAALAGFMFGWLWYGTLSKPWLAAQDRTAEEIKRRGRPLPMLLGLTIVAQLIMAWIFAGLMLHLAKAGIPATAVNGMFSGLLLWVGFIASTTVVNHGYQGHRWMLTAIDCGHWLGVLLLQGAIIGAWGLVAR